MTTSLRVLNADGSVHKDWGQAGGGYLGDFPAGGTVSLALYGGTFTNVDVPIGGVVVWSFLLTNHDASGTDWHAFDDALIKVGEGLVSAFITGVFGAGGAWASLALVAGINKLISLLTAACDGNVAADAWKFSDGQLANMTNNANKAWYYTNNYPGTNSPAGCGSNSNYDVGYLVNEYVKSKEGPAGKEGKEGKEHPKEVKEAKDNPHGLMPPKGSASDDTKAF